MDGLFFVILCLDNWEQRKLGEVGEITAGGDKDPKKLKKEGKYPVIANNLENDGIIGYYENSYKIDAPAITITARGNIGNATARVVNFTPVVRLLVLKTNLDTKFMEQSINNVKFFIESTGVPQLTVPQLSNYSIFVPKRTEQHKIGLIFNLIDTLITLYERKVKSLLQIKKYLLDNLFAEKEYPKLRFKGFFDAWEQRKVKNIFKYEQPTKYLVTNTNYCYNGIPVLTANKSFVLGYSNNKNVYTEIPAIIFDDFTLDSKYVDFPFLLKSSAIKILKNKKNNNLYFGFLLLSNKNIVQQGHSRHYISVVQNIRIQVPKLEEQNKISKFIKYIDNLLAFI